MKIAATVTYSWMLMLLGIGSAYADAVSCEGIKRALVSSNLALMRIERGPLPVDPAQASLAIGQMTALMNLAPLACGPEDADKIGLIVMPRRDALQLLLPAPVPTIAEPVPASDASAARSDTPTPPPRPANETHNRQPGQGSVSATSCTRVYYLKNGYRYWRCKR
jgi:hypothetical protein